MSVPTRPCGCPINQYHDGGCSAAPPSWLNYDTLLHGKCGRKLSEHPYPHASGLDFGCTFEPLPPVKFATAPQASGLRTREEIEELLDELEPEELETAIEILQKREDAWQDWLSMPSI
jgi:hypothetical protein